MKDAKGHGSEKRGGGGDQPTTQARPQARPPAMHSFKKGKRSQRGSSGGGSSGSGGGGGGQGGGSGGGGGGGMHPKSGAHTKAIHRALGMNLAQLSAAGTNPNIPKPVIGARK